MVPFVLSIILGAMGHLRLQAEMSMSIPTGPKDNQRNNQNKSIKDGADQQNNQDKSIKDYLDKQCL